jgi:glutathione-regulated potassium-efflux system protein KefB
MGAEGLRALGFAQAASEDTAEDIRRRDEERLPSRFKAEVMSGRDRLLLPPAPGPLIGR